LSPYRNRGPVFTQGPLLGALESRQSEAVRRAVAARRGRRKNITSVDRGTNRSQYDHFAALQWRREAALDGDQTRKLLLSPTEVYVLTEATPVSRSLTRKEFLASSGTREGGRFRSPPGSAWRAHAAVCRRRATTASRFPLLLTPSVPARLQPAKMNEVQLSWKPNSKAPWSTTRSTRDRQKPSSGSRLHSGAFFGRPRASSNSYTTVSGQGGRERERASKMSRRSRRLVRRAEEDAHRHGEKQITLS